MIDVWIQTAKVISATFLSFPYELYSSAFALLLTFQRGRCARYHDYISIHFTPIWNVRRRRRIQKWAMKMEKHLFYLENWLTSQKCTRFTHVCALTEETRGIDRVFPFFERHNFYEDKQNRLFQLKSWRLMRILTKI